MNEHAVDKQGIVLNPTIKHNLLKLAKKDQGYNSYKYRIGPFTGAFHEQVIQHIPDLLIFKTKIYLESHQFLSRYVNNKRIKTQGFFCFQLDAKRERLDFIDGNMGDDPEPQEKWFFRPVNAGFTEDYAPPATCGLFYTWTPTVTDPHARMSLYLCRCGCGEQAGMFRTAVVVDFVRCYAVGTCSKCGPGTRV